MFGKAKVNFTAQQTSKIVITIVLNTFNILLSFYLIN